MANAETRHIQLLQKIAVEAEKIRKIFETMNENLAAITKAQQMEQFKEYCKRDSLDTMAVLDPTRNHFARVPNEFDLHQLVGSTVRVCDEHDERFSQRGKVTGINHLGILVKFENEVVPTNFFREDQLELIPKSKDGRAVPVRDGIGGPVIGTAKISEDEIGLIADMEIGDARNYVRGRFPTIGDSIRKWGWSGRPEEGPRPLTESEMQERKALMQGMARPRWHIGAQIKVIDPKSPRYGQIGIVTQLHDTVVDLDFGQTGGDFDYYKVALVSNTTVEERRIEKESTPDDSV